MGANQSDLRNIHNDFELVIRASKAMEQELHKMFDTEPHVPIASNINRLEAAGAKAGVVCDLRKLTRWRNKLVHDPSVNSLGMSHATFLDKWEEGLQEINRIRYGHDNSNRALVSASSRSTVTQNEHSSGTEMSGGTMAALAIGALAVGAFALAGGASGGWYCDDCGSRHSGFDGDLRYNCRQCINFDVCSDCFSRRTPPLCGHRNFRMHRHADDPWINVTWPSNGGPFW